MPGRSWPSTPAPVVHAPRENYCAKLRDAGQLHGRLAPAHPHRAILSIASRQKGYRLDFRVAVGRETTGAPVQTTTAWELLWISAECESPPGCCSAAPAAAFQALPASLPAALRGGLAFLSCYLLRPAGSQMLEFLLAHPPQLFFQSFFD